MGEGAIGGGDAASTPADHPSVSAEAFLAAMREAVTAVSLVTTSGDAGEYGVTVSAIASVSADPPLVLACINRRSPAEAAIRANGIFCINVLTVRQSHSADVFSGRSPTHSPYDFGCATWTTGLTGAKRLDDAAASFECEVFSAVEAGTHTVLIGRVVGLTANADVPLIYHNRSYCRPIPLQAA